MCENPEPRHDSLTGGDCGLGNCLACKREAAAESRRSFRSDTIAPTESAWASVGNPPPEEHDLARAGREFGKPDTADDDTAPLFEVFGVLEASENGGEVQVRVVRCEWFARCKNDATHIVDHPAFKSGVPACDAHGV